MGVIGVGTMGRHHVRIASQTESVVMAGLHDPDAERAAQFCDEYGCESFAGLNDLLDRCDAVTIAAPTSLHGEIGLTCLERGKHVLMEKPLAHDTAAAEALTEKARQSGLVLMVGHVERYNPAIQALHEALQKEQQDVITIDARRLAPFDGSRCLDVDVFYDLLIHDIDLALEIADSPVKSVSATGRPVYSHQIDVAHCRIDFENGCTAAFWTGKCSPKKVRLLSVATSRSLYEADTLRKTLTVHTAEEQPAMDKGVCFMGELREEQITVPDEEPLRAELEDFFSAVVNGHDPLVTGQRALEGLRVLEQVRQAARAGA